MSAASSIACIVLAAGKGTRMKSRQPKVLHQLAGLSLLQHVLRACDAIEAERTVVVVGPDMADVEAVAAPRDTVVQALQRGTGDAVRSALTLLTHGSESYPGTVLVLYGDTPLVEPATLQRMVAAAEPKRAVEQDERPAVVVLGMRPAEPGRYGRLVTDSTGRLIRIVEFLDASPQERSIGLCNAGLMALDGRRIGRLVEGIKSDNAKNEFYLTDAVAVARQYGWGCEVVEVESATEVLGVNSRPDLATLEGIIQDRLRRQHMEAGVTLQAPETVFLCHDTKIGQDTVVAPHVVFGKGVCVGEAVTIRSYSHLEGVTVGDNAEVGPFARLRPGTVLASDVHIGNFVEIKNVDVGSGSKINHLSYIGDASIGPGSNIGAGTITCNYDGVRKHKTTVGAGAFIGSNTALVAPVTVGDGAIVGAGSVITNPVEADSLAVARSRQVGYAGWASRFRQDRRRNKP